MYIRALQGHSGENLDFSTLSSKQKEKGYAPFLYRVGSSRNEYPIKSGGRVPGGFGISRVRKAVCSSRVSSLDPNPDPKYKPCYHLNKHHDRLSEFDFDAAQNSLEFLSDSERECLVLRHSSVRVPHKDHQSQRRIRKVRKIKI